VIQDEMDRCVNKGYSVRIIVKRVPTEHKTERNGENKRVGPSNKWEVAKAYNYFFYEVL